MSHNSPVWLFELQIDGRVERFATRAVAVSSDSGDLMFRDGLGEVSLDLAAVVSGGEISTAILIAADWLEGLAVGGGWSVLVAAWHSLEGSTGVLRRWVPGTAYEDARIMLRGELQDVEHGGRAEPLEFTLRRNLFAGSRPLLATSERVDVTTWPTIADPLLELDAKAVGSYYPRVIGTPGDVSAGGLTPTPRAAVPAILAQSRGGGPGQNNRLVVAVGAVDAGEVQLWDYSEDPPVSDLFPVQLEVDELGQQVSTVEIANPTSLRPEFGHAFYTGWGAFNTRGGGTLRPGGRSGYLEGLGEVLQYLVERHTRVDLVELDPRLDSWRLATWFNEGELGAWDWITNELGPLCPFRLFEGRLGLAVRLFDWRARAVDAVARFDVGLRQVERVSGVRSRSADTIANRVVVEYQRDRATGSYLERYTLDAAADPNDLVRSGASLRAAVSQSRLKRAALGDDGVRELVIQTPHIWDPAVARRVASFAMAERALPPLEVTYKGDVGLEQRIDPCDVVVINDPEVGLVERVAVVDRLTPRPSDTLLSLVVLNDPTSVKRPQL